MKMIQQVKANIHFELNRKKNFKKVIEDQKRTK